MSVLHPADEDPFGGRRLAHKVGVMFVFLVAMAFSALGDTTNAALRAAGALAGLGLALGMSALWRDRLRPKNAFPWWVLGLALGAWLFFAGFEGVPAGDVGWYVVLPLTIFLSLFVFHDQALAPTLLLGASMWMAIIQPDLEWRRAGENEAWWIGFTALLGVFAAALERERLLRRDGAGTPLQWVTIRLAFVGIWTIIILSLREDVQWGQLFAWLGIDPAGEEGQVIILSILLAALILAVLVFKPSKRKGPSNP